MTSQSVASTALGWPSSAGEAGPDRPGQLHTSGYPAGVGEEPGSDNIAVATDQYAGQDAVAGAATRDLS